jgi:hypothetical protein
MPAPAGLRFRAAGPGDAHAIAGLHADSWQRHYRGARRNSFRAASSGRVRLTVPAACPPGSSS